MQWTGGYSPELPHLRSSDGWICGAGGDGITASPAAALGRKAGCDCLRGGHSSCLGPAAAATSALAPAAT